MNGRQRMMAVLRHEEIDQIPFTMYAETLKIFGLALYEPWRKLLDQGLSLFVAEAAQPYKVQCPNASMDITHHYKTSTSWAPVDILVSLNTPHIIAGNIQTPVGDDKFHASVKGLDMSVQLPWFPEDGFIIKSLNDYEVIKFLVEDSEYTPFYDDITEFQALIGDYGVVPAFMPKSPLQSMIMLMGLKQIAIGYHAHRKEFDDLYHVIYKKEIELFKIAAESPAEVIWGPDNVTSLITSPILFEKYNLPFYNEVSDILHKQDKVYVVHMDGALHDLVDLIARTKIDAIESFTPPPTGNLSIHNARKAWKDKVIWANFPESECLHGGTAVRKITRQMLADAAPGDNFLMGISEGFPSFLHMLENVPKILKTVVKHGKYPISTS
ncbi:MAG: uroporphyrinogen decarboxylase family protein [Candidatus Hodarchaeota archaeon]